jgi:hypothetical protein
MPGTATIGKPEIRLATYQLFHLLKMHRKMIDQAYLAAEKGLDVTLKVTFKEPSDDPENIPVKTTISYKPAETVKDEMTGKSRDRQKKFDFGKEKEKKSAPHTDIPMSESGHCIWGYGPWCQISRWPCLECRGRVDMTAGQIHWQIFHDRKERERE